MKPKTKKATATKKAIAIDTVRNQLLKLTRANADLTTTRDTFKAENELLRKQNVQLANVIETDLTTDLKLRIQARSNYTDSHLTTLNLDQLQQIDKTLNMGKPEADTTFKSIRAGTASANSGLTTVGSLYLKSRKEILESGGDF